MSHKSFCLNSLIFVLDTLGWKERNVLYDKFNTFLFNDTLNTCYLRLCDFKHMAKDHYDNERGNPLLPLHGLLLAARVLLYAPSHTQDSPYRGLCYTSRNTLAPMNRSLMGIEQFIILELIVKISGILPNSPYVVKR